MTSLFLSAGSRTWAPNTKLTPNVPQDHNAGASWVYNVGVAGSDSLLVGANVEMMYPRRGVFGHVNYCMPI